MISWSNRPERLDDVHPRCPGRRQHAPDKSHDQRKSKTLPNNAKGEGKTKGEFGKGLKIQRRDGEKLEKRSKEEAEATTDQAEKQSVRIVSTQSNRREWLDSFVSSGRH